MGRPGAISGKQRWGDLGKAASLQGKEREQPKAVQEARRGQNEHPGRRVGTSGRDKESFCRSAVVLSPKAR